LNETRKALPRLACSDLTELLKQFLPIHKEKRVGTRQSSVSPNLGDLAGGAGIRSNCLPDPQPRHPVSLPGFSLRVTEIEGTEHQGEPAEPTAHTIRTKDTRRAGGA
jgi:hypothetical protein